MSSIVSKAQARWLRRVTLIALANVLPLASVDAQAPGEVGSADEVQLPDSSEGSRLGLTFYGGWDSNALDVPGGPSDVVYELGANLAYGKRGLRSVFGISAEGFRQGFREFEERSTWRGAAALMTGWRPSRTLVLGLAAGASYDYADNFVGLDGLVLPRSQAVRLNGDASLEYQLALRTRWLTDVRYEGVLFESGALSDTQSGRVRSSLVWRKGVGDEVSVSYRYLIARWGGTEDVNHSALLGWRHTLSPPWSFEIQSGVTRLRGAVGEDGESNPWRVVGEGSLSRVSPRSTVAASYSRFITAGYGFGQFQFSETFALTATLSLASRVELNATGALDRSRALDDSIRGQTEWAEVRLVTALHRRLAFVVSYGYRHRDYSTGAPVDSHRVGLAVTSAIESRPAQTPRESSR